MNADKARTIRVNPRSSASQSRISNLEFRISFSNCPRLRMIHEFSDRSPRVSHSAHGNTWTDTDKTTPFSCISWLLFLVAVRRMRALLLNQHLEDVPGQRLFDLGVAWNWLAHSGFGILVPVVPFAGADEGAPFLLDSADQIAALHESRSSATFSSF